MEEELLCSSFAQNDAYHNYGVIDMLFAVVQVLKYENFFNIF